MKSEVVVLRRAPVQRGFTLLEMLVVMIIVAMLGSLLFDAAVQVMNLQARFGRQVAGLRGEALRLDWVRQAVEGLQPDYADGKQVFKGSRHEFSGLTTNPLSAGYGGLEPFAFTLHYDAAHDETALRYGSGNEAPTILRWRGNRGQFRYLDDKGEAHDDWPPPLGLWPQLPTAIYVEGRDDNDAPMLLVAAPHGPAWPVPRPIDVMGTVQ